MSVEAPTVGRQKKTVRPKPTPLADEAREAILSMKGSPEYAAWLEAIHRRTHIPKVQIFRIAVAEWAERLGLPAPPEI